MTTYAPLAVAIVIFITVTYIFFPEIFRSKRHVYDQDWLDKQFRDKKYPTDTQIASARVLSTIDAAIITNKAKNNPDLEPDAEKEFMAMMYMIEQAARRGETSVTPGIDDRYVENVVLKLQRFGYEVKPNGAGTYEINWNV